MLQILFTHYPFPHPVCPPLISLFMFLQKSVPCILRESLLEAADPSFHTLPLPVPIVPPYLAFTRIRGPCCTR